MEEFSIPSMGLPSEALTPTELPTKAPTNEGDTYSPTAFPTAMPVALEGGSSSGADSDAPKGPTKKPTPFVFQIDLGNAFGEGGSTGDDDFTTVVTPGCEYLKEGELR
jgi:hypothetical protein